MKNKLFKTCILGIFSLSLLFLGTSCSTDDEPDAYFDRVPVNVRVSDWQWVYDEHYTNEGYYIATVNVPELTEYIYKNGVITFYNVFGDGARTTLPYTRTYGYDIFYNDNTKGRGYYTENVSCEFLPGRVSFIIEASDLNRADEYLENKKFELGMVW